jgi:predicted RecB family nuclease
VYRNNDGTLVWSPSDLVTYLKSPFASWMDRLKVERPGLANPDEGSPEDELVKEKGMEHERAWLGRCRERGDVAEIEGPEIVDKIAATRAAIASGRRTIYQAALGRDGFEGYADFLRRVDAETDSGRPDDASGAGFQYEVVDTKLARRPTPYFLIQLCAYAEMLEAIQGRRPEHLHVVLGQGEEKSFRTDDFFYAYLEVKRGFLELMRGFDPDQRPEPDPDDDHGRWESYAERWAEEVDHLARVAGVTRSQIRKLTAAGITTLADLAKTTAARVPKLGDPQFERMRAQARLQLASPADGPPAFEIQRPDPKEPWRGLGCLPPASPGDAWIDFEGFPLADQPLEYLFAATTADDGRIEYHDWWAHDAAQEKRALEGFVDFVFARWRRDPGMHLYHYGAYEVTALRRLIGFHATRETEVDALLRAEVFVDLHVVVRQGLRVGTPRYSLKHVERLFRPPRAGGVTTGAESIVAYHEFRESGESQDWRQSDRLRQIRDYNADDCESTRLLTEWLRGAQQAEGIGYWSAARVELDDEGNQKDPAAVPENDQEAATLAATLLAEIPSDPEARKADAARWDLQEILAQLLGFHRREQKPMWWALYDRHAMTHEQLAEDLSCLGNLQRLDEPPEQVKRSRAWSYGFDPEQDTKLEIGSSCFFSHDLAIKVKLEKLDRRGRALVKLGDKTLAKIEGGTPPATLSLIPDEYVSQDPLKAAILDLVKSWRGSGSLPRHVEHVLLRRPAAITGHGGGPFLRRDEGGADGGRRIAPLLDRTTLCIQGPPGTGKTYTGAQMILDLVALGKRVGVTATGHAAIDNLLKKCCELKEGAPLACIKVRREPPAEVLAASRSPKWMTPDDAAGATDVPLVGGTAWFFSREDVGETFDYLFVDEAGQFSLANLLAVARSCKNFVLLGDQLQLGQPVQGSHPGKSGLSALDYVLDGQHTIRDDFGVFLAETRRLHPRICEFISGAIYENRLRPLAGIERRVVRLPPGAAGSVQAESGLVFVPVEHDGCTQCSDEEVAVIGDLVRDLVGRERVDETGVHRVKLQDILIVAPYNMQVRRLKAALPAGALVGSVDLFQGQEAPIVIVSMCASDGASSPRGIEFLFNRNRLNVAISRAQSLAIVVGNPILGRTRCSSISQMGLVNTFCRILETARPWSAVRVEPKARPAAWP